MKSFLKTGAAALLVSLLGFIAVFGVGIVFGAICRAFYSGWSIAWAGA
jgi:hypothetical protein